MSGILYFCLKQLPVLSPFPVLEDVRFRIVALVVDLTRRILLDPSFELDMGVLSIQLVS